MSNLWAGKEKEGIFKGIKTLFIGSPNITFNHIKKYIKEYKISQLYFGAGMCSVINKNLIFQCLRKIKYILITTEVDINELHKYKDLLLISRINFIITTTNNNFSLLNNINELSIQIKVQSLNKNKVIGLAEWRKFDKVDVKKLSGKTYKGDVILDG